MSSISAAVPCNLFLFLKGNDVSTVVGAAATGVALAANGVTFGQVDAINELCETTAKFTARKAKV